MKKCSIVMPRPSTPTDRQVLWVCFKAMALIVAVCGLIAVAMGAMGCKRRGGAGVVGQALRVTNSTVLLQPGDSVFVQAAPQSTPIPFPPTPVPTFTIAPASPSASPSPSPAFSIIPTAAPTLSPPSSIGSLGQDNRSTTVAGTTMTEVVSLRITPNPTLFYTISAECHVSVLTGPTAATVSGQLCMPGMSQGTNSWCDNGTLPMHSVSIPANSWGELSLASEWENAKYASIPFYCMVKSTGPLSAETNEISAHASPQ